MRCRSMVLVMCALIPTVAGLVPIVARAQSTAGCTGPEYRQFDFWVGEWEVRTPKGTLAGTNRIEKILDGCVLRESWTGSRGMRGTSLNMYSAADRQWHQTWMDSNGLLLVMSGGLENGRMVLAGETRSADGGTLLNRITWEKLEDARVRQHWETSADSGRTWQDAFVGLYRRTSESGGSQ